MTKLNSIKKELYKRKYFFWYGSGLFWLAIYVGIFVRTPQLLLMPINELITFSYQAFIPILLGFLFTIPIRYIFKRYAFHRFKIFKAIVLVLVTAILGAWLWTSYQFLYSYILTGSRYKTDPLSYIQQIYNNSWPFILWCSLYIGFKIWEDWSNQKLQLEKERGLLKSAQLDALRYQLNPHFLFNTLNSARTLVITNPSLAQEMLTQISEFLRYSLSDSKRSIIQLKKEIEAINNYLDIEKIRFKNNLVVEFNIDPKTEYFEVPIFLILPLIENAVKHGMKTTVLPLKIFIATYIDAEYLVIRVSNTGRWIDSSSDNTNHNTGTGLKNLIERLENTYDNNYSLNIDHSGDLIKATIKIKITSNK